MADANIIPDVIADFPPSLGLHVTWPGTGWPRLDRALLGNTLDPRRLHGQPAIGLHDISAASPSSSSAVSYVITLTDADASPHASHPHFHEDGGKKKGEYCHWIASGTLRPSLCDPKEPGPCPPVLVDVEEVFKYKGPAPKKGTGKHRYVFLAFVPSNGTTEKLHLSKPKGRRGWGADHGVEGWAGENGLAAVERRMQKRRAKGT
ncbi:phosphatidylethanolamine-binding protein [Staphylotrichum tortipilum]|uniref:Phosphatidylethanolamine-binding protein n=1 Tax=Staphylotrichum tortipilum TaxID=2831512 RepID=A0AAN6MMI7_9PEZI|nr:phosphatidylethanolamine-binding protein [Staphylotrichum longicolle]